MATESGLFEAERAGLFFRGRRGDADRLRRTGARVEFCEADVDHRVGAACLTAFGARLFGLPLSTDEGPTRVS